MGLADEFGCGYCTVLETGLVEEVFFGCGGFECGLAADLGRVAAAVAYFFDSRSDRDFDEGVYAV